MKTCKDFDYTGVKCCPVCHEYDQFDTVKIDGAPARLCCTLRVFFYPGRATEEKLLNAIFGHEKKNDYDD